MTAVIRAGRGALQRVDHDQHFHDRIVDRAANDWTTKTSFSRTLSLDADEGVVVAELEDVGAAERNPDVGADLARQLGVGVAREDTQLIIVTRHANLPWRSSPGALAKRWSCFRCYRLAVILAHFAASVPPRKPTSASAPDPPEARPAHQPQPTAAPRAWWGPHPGRVCVP